MALFSKKCPNCGHENPNEAGFCANCGKALGGGEITCGNCGTKNRGDAHFCKKCGRALDANAVAETRGQSWARGEGDFAVHIEADDLPGLLRRGISVQMGTNAILVQDGANRGELGPGPHALDTLDERLANWLLGGPPKKVSVLLVDVLPAELEFNMGGIFTKDPIRIGMTVHVQAQVEQPARFLVQMLASRERYSREDLRQYLYPEVAQLVENWIGQHTVQELAEDLSLKEKLELALDEALKPTLARLGLKFIAVRTLNMNMEHLDHIKGIRSNYALQVTEAEAEAQGRQSLLAAMKQLNLQKMAEEIAKVEDEEKRADLYHRMRQAVINGKMDEVRSEAEFDTFLDDMDRKKLLREKERADLLRTWKEDAEDQGRTRAHMLAKLETQQKYELAVADLNMRQDLGRKDLEFEMEMQRKRAEQEYSVRSLEWEYALKKEETDAKIRSTRHKQELEEDRDDLELAWEQMDKLKAKQEREKEHDLKLKLDEQRANNELEIQRLRMQHEFEMQRMDRLTNMSVEAIIATSGPEQGRILADLKRTEALKGMSEDQILALMAEHSPEVAHALEEKFRSMAAGKASAREQEMYEKLLAERETRNRDTTEAWRESTQAVRGMADKALDSVKDTATAFARGQGGTPVIITESGVIRAVDRGRHSADESASDSKTCPKCGRAVLAEAYFCQHCGNKFEGMK